MRPASSSPVPSLPVSGYFPYVHEEEHPMLRTACGHARRPARFPDGDHDRGVRQLHGIVQEDAKPAADKAAP